MLVVCLSESGVCAVGGQVEGRQGPRGAVSRMRDDDARSPGGCI